MLIIFGLIVFGSLLSAWIIEKASAKKNTETDYAAIQSTRKRWKYYSRNY